FDAAATCVSASMFDTLLSEMTLFVVPPAPLLEELATVELALTDDPGPAPPPPVEDDEDEDEDVRTPVDAEPPLPVEPPFTSVPSSELHAQSAPAITLIQAVVTVLIARK